MVVYTKSGVTVNCYGNIMTASDGKTYNLCGRLTRASSGSIRSRTGSFTPIRRMDRGTN